MFKKRSARAGGARKTTPKVQASNATSAPSLLSFGADDDEGPTFEVKKRKLKQKKKRTEIASRKKRKKRKFPIYLI